MGKKPGRRHQRTCKAGTPQDRDRNGSTSQNPENHHFLQSGDVVRDNSDLPALLGCKKQF